MVHGNAPRHRNTLKLLALAATLGIVLVGLAQCRAVPDTVTGVELSTGSGTLHSRNACVNKCNESYKAARSVEELRYRHALRGCGRDSACKKAEHRKHRGILADLARARQNCKRNCYNEGGGSAGR